MTSISNRQNRVRQHRQIPVDPKLPGLRVLLNSDAVLELLNKSIGSDELPYTSCQIVYVRYKPETNCTVTYQTSKTALSDGDEGYEFLSGKCYNEVDFAVAREKSNAAGSNYRVISDDSTGCIFRDCIVDSVLKGMTTFDDRRKLRRILYDLIPSRSREEWRISHKRMTSQMIRYKPEKRAVMKLVVPVTHLVTNEKKENVFYVRIYANSQGETIFNRMKSLCDLLPEDAPVVFPSPVFYHDQTGLLFTTEVEGEVVFDSLTTTAAIGAIERSAKVLASFHSIGTAKIGNRTRAERMSDVLATAETLRIIAPDLSGFIEKISFRLSRLQVELPSSHEGVVHGDFHPGQVLLGKQSDALLDFDRTYNGDQFDDLGNYVAHLHLLQLNGGVLEADESTSKFVSTYEEQSGRSVDQLALKFWTGCGLMQLAVSPFRSFEENWTTKISAILQRCCEVIA